MADATNTMQAVEEATLKQMNRDLALFHSAEVEALLLRYRQVERLIGDHTHHGSEGEFCEALVREFLRGVLPRRFSIDTGFIRSELTQTGGEKRFVSHQLDVIVHDTTDYSPVFRSGNFVVVMPDAVAAVVEVKKRLTSSELKDSLDKLAVARCLTYNYRPQFHPADGRRVFTGLFAFTSHEDLQPKSKDFSDTYRNRLVEIAGQIPPMYSVPDVIAVMDREIVVRGQCDELETPFSVIRRSASVNDINLACQNFLFSLMLEMRAKEVHDGNYNRYAFPPLVEQNWSRILTCYEPPSLSSLAVPDW